MGVFAWLGWYSGKPYLGFQIEGLVKENVIGEDKYTGWEFLPDCFK